MAVKNIGKKLRAFSIKTRMDSTNKFKDKLLEMFKGYIKAVVMWGSITRGDFHGKSDVDTYIIFDDTKLPLGKFNEIREKIDNDIYKLAAATDPRLHLQPVIALTEFWDGIRTSHPLFYNIVREGYAVYDTGFFIPMRKLLEWGKFPATIEAAEHRMEGVPKRIVRVKSVKLMMITEDLYYAVVDAAQAILMYLGIGGPAPKVLAREIRKYLVDEKLLEPEWADFIEEMVKFRKGVEYKEIKEISGAELDKWIDKSEKFVKRIDELLKQIALTKKAKEIKSNYEVMIAAIVTTLKNMNKLPPEPEKLPEAFIKHIIEPGLVPENYVQVFDSIIKMRKMLDDKKISEIKERDVYMNKEYVRHFVNRLKNVIHAKPEDIEKILKSAAERKNAIKKIEEEEKAKAGIEEAEKNIETSKEIEKLPESMPQKSAPIEAKKDVEKKPSKKQRQEV